MSHEQSRIAQHTPTQTHLSRDFSQALILSCLTSFGMHECTLSISNLPLCLLCFCMKAMGCPLRLC